MAVYPFSNDFFASDIKYEKQWEYTVLRSPHIARNEELIVKRQSILHPIREKYLNHLSDVIIVAPESLFAERLGGADYDGDMVKTIADPIIVKSVKANYTQIKGKNEMYDNENGSVIVRYCMKNDREARERFFLQVSLLEKAA